MKKIISLILALLMVTAALPFGALAADEAPFTDVVSGSWYEDAVMWCYANGYMSGTSATTFAPAGEMTRSMFATVLCAVAGVDKDTVEYKGSFTDVPDGQWYTAAVEWAAENGIVSGIGNGLFGTNAPVTRETIVLMMYKFMQYMGVDTTVKVEEDALAPYGDVAALHDWAAEAMTWAISHGIISGTGTVKGAPLSAPLKTATRAEVAVIIKNALNLNLETENPVGQFLLGGVDVSQFTIVYGDTGSYGNRTPCSEIAKFMKTRILEATGVELAVASDDERPAVEGAYEILIGKTNREDTGLVTVDREGVEGDALFYEMQDNYLIIASNERFAGTALAANRFCEDVLGFENFGNGIVAYTSIKTASIENGVRVDDAPDMDLIVNYQMDGWNAFYSPSESSGSFINIVHSIPLLACDGSCGFSISSVLDHGHHIFHHMDSDPCLSDSDNIRTTIKNVKTLIEAKKNNHTGRFIWLSQSDGEAYCKCESCRQIYLLFGRCATYVQLLNYVAEEIAEEYPEYILVGLAYKYTVRPPKLPSEISDEDYAEFVESYTQDIVPPQDITSPDNVAMCVCTDSTCYAHAVNDPNCKHTGKNNNTFAERFDTWCRIVPNIYIWDYLNACMYAHTPWPNIHSICDNYTYYYENGVSGVYALGHTDRYGDFGELRTYLIAEFCMDSENFVNNFWTLVNEFLHAFYGDGYTYIREYIEILETLASKNEFDNWMASWWDTIITEEDWNENYDYMRSLWDKALALADTEEEIANVKYTMTQILYVEVQMAYHKYAESRSDADLAAFRALNEAYVEHLDEVGLARPSNWASGGDPDNWVA